MAQERRSSPVAPSAMKSSIPAQGTPPLGETQPFPRRDEEVFPRPFGRYELRSLLGRGGMGAVYLAHDPHLDRLVALKMPRALNDDPTVWRERFLTEARAAATLHHPNICAVYEVGEVEGLPYVVMEYVAGGTLADLLQRRPQPALAAARWLATFSRSNAESEACCKNSDTAVTAHSSAKHKLTVATGQPNRKRKRGMILPHGRRTANVVARQARRAARSQRAVQVALATLHDP